MTRLVGVVVARPAAEPGRAAGRLRAMESRRCSNDLRVSFVGWRPCAWLPGVADAGTAGATANAPHRATTTMRGRAFARREGLMGGKLLAIE